MNSKDFKKYLNIYWISIIGAFVTSIINYFFYKNNTHLIYILKKSQYIYMFNYLMMIAIVIFVSYVTILVKPKIAGKAKSNQRSYIYTLLTSNYLLLDLFFIISFAWLKNKKLYLTIIIAVVMILNSLIKVKLNKLIQYNELNIKTNKKYIIKPELPHTIGLVMLVIVFIYCGLIRDTMPIVDVFDAIKNTYPDITTDILASSEYKNFYQTLTINNNSYVETATTKTHYDVKLVYHRKNNKWVQVSKEAIPTTSFNISGQWDYQDDKLNISVYITDNEDSYKESIISYKINKYGGYEVLTKEEDEYTSTLTVNDKPVNIKVDKEKFIMNINNKEIELTRSDN